ncbi:hypothetical protein [Nocardia vulneris]|uniref:hypothetical protein n=1 Tax=Nocardia vulneris TaxID=1141657 RepID=UPI000A95038E|nr:hypothetical protein [Nocardia vulneris]
MQRTKVGDAPAEREIPMAATVSRASHALNSAAAGHNHLDRLFHALRLRPVSKR